MSHVHITPELLAKTAEVNQAINRDANAAFELGFKKCAGDLGLNQAEYAEFEAAARQLAAAK